MAIAKASLIAIGVAFLLAAGSSSANATFNPRCGTGLVAGMASCIEWMMKISEYRDLAARARKGDNEAAVKLAQFEDERRDRRPDGGWQWWILAAKRGDCQALRTVRDVETSMGRSAAAAQWQTLVRRNRCKPKVPGERWLGPH